MLNKAKTIKGYKLHSKDGEIGTVKEFYFDDYHWVIRYLVASTGNWLTGRLVLLSPHSLLTLNKEGQYISVNLTKKQIEDSPSIDSDKPVSRQVEETYSGYYGWPMYWTGPFMGYEFDSYISYEPENWRKTTPGEKEWNPHLRSSREVTGYSIQATDGDIGIIDDFLLDDDTWAIRYLIVDTGNWWPGKKVLISPRWIENVSWSESKVFVNLSRETIKQSPEYLENNPPTRDYETGLHRHYDRQGYWNDKPAAKEHSR